MILLVACAPKVVAPLPAPAVEARGEMILTPYPFNGVVVNESSTPLMVHDCDSRSTTVLAPDPAGSSTPAYTEDWDYFSADGGRTWRKVGGSRVVVTDFNVGVVGECEARLCKPCAD